MSIELININKKFNDFELKNINFTVETGNYFALLGRSGAGKTLILELISGFKLPDSGKILINGKDVTRKKIQERKIGVVFQDLAVFPHKTVRENIEFSLRGKNTETKTEIISQLAKEFNIEHLLNKKPANMSGGELQRTAIARTLASEPEVLLLDEPLSALDIQLKDEAAEILAKIRKKGITVIHITHDFNEAVRLADKVAVINKGQILQTGNINDVFGNPNSKFAANFAGIDNFFDAEIIEKKSDKSVKLKVAQKIDLIAQSDENHGKGFVIIRNEDILILPEFAVSSARNNFNGKITNIIRDKYGLKIKVDTGIPLTATITENSAENLHLSVNSQIWVSIKATAVKFVKH